MVCPHLIHLASQSPRRRELLEGAGFDVSVVPGRQEPKLAAAGRGAAEAQTSARAKLPALMDDALVLSADTVVHLNGQCLGKPVDAQGAIHMLHLLSGQTHQVTTAVAFRSPKGVHEFLSTSSVSFRVLSRAEIELYVASGEPMDKAGGYGIQGRGAGLVKHVEGCHTTVVGLPLPETLRQLASFGVVPR